jgi:nitrite reductase/ring-hydroxylating ferredoxin subunit/DMSO/TMAO reductase YedYZ heme-binding membrane subunit
MSARFRFISWTPYKKRYDLVLAAAVATYLLTFAVLGKLIWRGAHSISDEILIMRALGTCAFLMLSFTLCIGPLARLDRRFLPLLYNRRHLGVATFLIGLAHAIIAAGFYHGFGRVSPLVSLLTSNSEYRSISSFPFEVLGLVSLIILMLMAGTSHDMWLKTLTPKVWKRLHMLVYPAWGFLVMHVALGALQTETNPIYGALLFGDVAVVGALHIGAGLKERRQDERSRPTSGAWVDVCAVDELAESRGKAVALPQGERVAIFRYAGKVSAMTNLCAHQGGPLGEGKIIDGCVTCPWHGYQYKPGDGCAPAPFTEKLPTYELRIEHGRVLVNPEALPPGTPVEPAEIEEVVHA